MSAPYDAEINLNAGEKRPIYAGVNTPVVGGVQSTFLASAANFALYQGSVSIISAQSIVSSFPSTSQANPQGNYDLDTGSGNPSGSALAPGFYEGIILVTGTGSDNVARTITFRYLIKILPVP